MLISCTSCCGWTCAAPRPGTCAGLLAALALSTHHPLGTFPAGLTSSVFGQEPGQAPQYTRSWVEALNARGYSVCGIDQQGLGYSEGLRNYVERFADYVTDVLQFAQCAPHRCAPRADLAAAALCRLPAHAPQNSAAPDAVHPPRLVRLACCQAVAALAGVQCSRPPGCAQQGLASCLGLLPSTLSHSRAVCSWCMSAPAPEMCSLPQRFSRTSYLKWGSCRSLATCEVAGFASRPLFVCGCSLGGCIAVNAIHQQVPTPPTYHTSAACTVYAVAVQVAMLYNVDFKL